MKTTNYLNKDINYFTKPRWDVISLLPTNTKSLRILEIGAGGGDTLVAIKENNLAQEVVGVDLFEIKNSNQFNPLVNKFIICNIEQDSLNLSQNYFDVIICADVLEHLLDPWSVIEKLTPLLKKGGMLIISVPNIREINTIFKIVICGDFKYNPKEGILDQTHFRFFCKKNIVELVNTKNLKVNKTISILNFYPKSPRNLLNKITFRIFEEFLSAQFLVISYKE